MHDPGVLSRRNMGRLGEATRKQALLWFQFRLLDPRCDSNPRRLRQLELHRPLRFPLHDHRAWQNLAAMCDVPNMQVDQVATPQLAVNREVEHGKVSNLMRILELNSDCPDVLRLQWWLLTD
jgi:hypothetical protein